MLVRLHKLLTFSRPYLADQRPTNIKLNCLANYIFLKDKIQLGLQLFTSIHMLDTVATFRVMYRV